MFPWERVQWCFPIRGGGEDTKKRQGQNRSAGQKFQGVLTPYFQKLLKRRREALGFSLRRLGEGLGVGWSTLRNWEEGRVCQCHPAHCRILSRFLAGEMDGELQRGLPFPHPMGRDGERSFPLGRMLEAMKWATGLYGQCQGWGGVLQEEMIQELERVIRGMAVRLRKSAFGQEKRRRRL